MVFFPSVLLTGFLSLMGVFSCSTFRHWSFWRQHCRFGSWSAVRRHCCSCRHSFNYQVRFLALASACIGQWTETFLITVSHRWLSVRIHESTEKQMFNIFNVINMINPNCIYCTKLHFVLTIWATNYNF